MTDLILLDTDGLVAAWNFDEGEGQYGHDDSPFQQTVVLGGQEESEDSDPEWRLVEHGFAEFRRGDSNGDSQVDISDAVTILDYLFGASRLTCLDAADANDDGDVGISDPIGLLTFLFGGGIRPVPPFLSCDRDPTPDVNGCSSYPLCALRHLGDIASTDVPFYCIALLSVLCIHCVR